jgi:hypothetical protein
VADSRHVLCAYLTGALIWPGEVSAQPETAPAMEAPAPRSGAQSGADPAALERARKLYDDARTSFEDERYREAALGFEAASKLDPHALSLYMAGQAWELGGEQGRAADAYARALVTPGLTRLQLESAKERLEALVMTLGVVVLRGEPSTRVQLDDHMALSLPARLHGEPGEHTLLLLHPDGTVERRSLTLIRGETLAVDTRTSASRTGEEKLIRMSEPRLIPVSSESESDDGGLWTTAGWVATGAGVSAFVGASVLGLAANDAEATFQARPSRETYDHAKTLETSTNVMLAAGVLLSGAGVGIIIWQGAQERRKASVDVRLLPSGAALGGRF